MNRAATIEWIVLLLLLLSGLALLASQTLASSSSRRPTPPLSIEELRSIQVKGVDWDFSALKHGGHFVSNNASRMRVDPVGLELLLFEVDAALSSSREVSGFPSEQLGQLSESVKLMTTETSLQLDVYRFHPFLNLYYARIDGEQIILIDPQLVEKVRAVQTLLVPELRPSTNPDNSPAMEME